MADVALREDEKRNLKAGETFKSPFETKESQMKQKYSSKLPPLKFKENPMYTRAPFIIGQEFCERLAYYGIATNIITYLTGVMNIANSTAASLTNIWSGTCYITPLLGAYFADAYFGRFWVILSLSCLYMVGLVGLSLSAGLPSLRPEKGQSASTGQAAFFWIMMYLIALGTGGIKPNVSTFGADQFNPKDERQRAMIPRYFNFFYAAINGGAVLSATVIVNLQTNVSWTVGFAVPAGSFFIATVIFVLGSRLYRKVPPGGSPFTRIFKTIRVAIKNRKRVVPSEEELHEVPGEMSIVPGQPKLPHSEGMRWLDKAASPVALVTIKEEDEESQDEAGDADEAEKSSIDKFLLTVTEVEEVKCVLRLLPIAFTLIFYQAIYAQMTTMFILQGEGMDTALGSLNVAPATVSVLDSISVIIFVFIYDLLIVPWFKKLGHPISLLQRIGAGYIVACLSMIVAGVVEVVRLQVVNDNNLENTDPTMDGAPTVPMSVWWQIPQYALVGVSEVLAMVGSMELFYQQAPDGMRSTCAALQLLTTGIGSYVAAALVAIIQAITKTGTSPGWVADNVNQGHMDYFFFTLAVIMAIVFVLYIFIAKRFVYRKQEHITFEPEVVALAPELRTGISCVPSVTHDMKADIDTGMTTFYSLRSIATANQDSLQVYMSSIRSRRASGHQATRDSREASV